MRRSDYEESADYLGSYEQDMTEQRIEGIEVLVEQLSNTRNTTSISYLLFFLHLKVNKLEHLCSGKAKKRRVCKDEDGRERRQGEVWKKDPCTSCRCR
ncbi:hypothetical protein SK128_025713, partial [Halocaridina rubra]